MDSVEENKTTLNETGNASNSFEMKLKGNNEKLAENREIVNASSDMIEDASAKVQYLNYRTADNPPIHLALLFAMQNVILALPWCLSMGILVAEFVCAQDDYNFKAMLLSTTLFLSGMTTLVQVTIGIRLPVYQGPTTAYIIPLLALHELPEYKCPSMSEIIKSNNITIGNLSTVNSTELTLQYREDVIYPRIQATMGCLALAGFIHMLTGLTGLVGLVMKLVGPLTIIPTTLLIGLNAFKVVTKFCQTHWGISSITAIISIVLSLYLNGRRMPIPAWSSKKKWHIVRYPLHQVLSILIALGVGWSLSVILTETGSLTNDKNRVQYAARTDARNDVIKTTPWFYFPYPGQFGKVGFSSGLFMAFLTASIYSISDSIADYHNCAKTIRVPPPPIHAINRGLMMEGFFSMISGLFGASHATSTFGAHIGTIGVTKVASRMVYILFPCIVILFGIIGKLAAVFITIPYPVLGGVQFIGFGMFIGLVMANLQYIDIHSTRNLVVIGMATLLGLMLPFWTNANSNAIDTGSSGFDEFLRVILSNPSLVGGFTACFLDNSLPGSREERGMTAWGNIEAARNNEKSFPFDYEEGYEIYEIQSWSSRVNKIEFTKFIPFFPRYDVNYLKCCTNKNKS